VVYFWHAQESTAKKLSGAGNFLTNNFINNYFLELK